MTERLIDEVQFQKLLEAINNLKDHDTYAERFLVAAAPVFFGAVLGLAFGFFTDWLKTRREKRKSDREREEKELSQLNIISTAMWFNIEEMLHVVMQQILPHREQSYAAAAALQHAIHNEAELPVFGASMQSKFPAMTTRCPVPHFIEFDLFKEIPFALEKDPELLKLSGWIISYENKTRETIIERNRMIDNAYTYSMNIGLNIEDISEQIRIQSHIGNIEAINALMLIRQVRALCKKIEALLKGYNHLPNVKLKGSPPPALDEAVRALELIAKEVVPDFPSAESAPDVR
jgi:hypothetical protein